MRNFLPLKTSRRRTREWNNTETSDSNKASSQPIGWNPRSRQWKMTTDNRRTQISESSPNSAAKRNSSKDQTVLEKSLDELESIQMEDEVKNLLVTIINSVINSGDAKAMVRHMWKAVKLLNKNNKSNGNRTIQIVQWHGRSMRSKLCFLFTVGSVA
jgi:hypothetical protein